jgi:chemosensory pili system protein ChpA (sensor histidine kinase/response regulator)
MQSRAGEMLATLDQLAGNASRLREQLRALEMQTELQMQSRASTADTDTARFDPLELDRFTRLQEISRMMAESSEDLVALNKILNDGIGDLDRDLVLQKRQGHALQQEIMGMRLVAFDRVSDRLYVAVRQAAQHAGISVRLDITGSGTEVDRSMLERLAPCLEHLVRNAVVHGIESAPERLAAGKPPTGEIRITVQQTGQHIHIEVCDDGAGLRKERIRSKAIGAGLLAQDAALSDDDAIALLQRSGFSTSEDLDMFSGRGIGLDVVQSEVRGMGGHLTIESQAGHGLRFAMVFPISTGLTQVVLFRVGDMTFGVPRSMLLQVLEPPALPAAQAVTTLQIAGHGAVDLFWAGDLLEGADPDISVAGGRDTIAVFGDPGAVVALQVTQALGEREMALKDLGPPFAALPALVSASALPTGDLLMIYNPLELVRAYGKPARRRRLARWGRMTQRPNTAAQNPAENPFQATILVVDDSITVRRVTQRLLQREGIQVVLANHGLEALEKLRTIQPDLILSDIEMPHMDGFDLIRSVRADPSSSDIPFIIISSRVGDKHRDIAQTLGANHYLGKPYSEPELLTLVRRYCPKKIPA